MTTAKPSPDAGLELQAGSLDELFVQAAAALCATLTDRDGVMPRESRVIDLEAESVEGLLAAWLRELVAVYEVEGMLFSIARVEVDTRTPGRVALKARIWGEPYDRQRHHLKNGHTQIDLGALAIRHQGETWATHLRFVSALGVKPPAPAVPRAEAPSC